MNPVAGTVAGTLCELYYRSCKWRGRLDFFVDPAERVNGHSAWAGSSRFAEALASLGVRKGEVVAFLCKSSARHAIAWFGTTLAGAVACSMHVRETPERLGEALAWLDAKVLVFDADLEEPARAAIAASGRAFATICTADGMASPAGKGLHWNTLPAGALPPCPGPSDLAAVILSSGSTGRPKGVMHTQRSLTENAKAGQILYAQVTPQDAALIMLQPSFAAWVNVVLPYVGGKGKIVFGGAFTPKGFLELMERERITMAPAVPTMWRMVFGEDVSRYDLSAMKNVSISGEPPALRDLEQIRERVCRNISSFYSSSEAGTGGAVLATTEDTLGKGKPATSGKPVVGADLKIVDPDGGFDDELPVGSIGEIVVSGPSLAVGYWKDEALTRAKFRDGWWRSGDMGRIDEDGDLCIEGRVDNVINTGGVKVHGEDVERAILSHPEVTQVGVVGVEDERWGHRIEAHVVAKSLTLNAAELDAWCRNEAGLAGFKVPKAFHFVDTLPTGPTGKLYRRALKDKK